MKASEDLFHLIRSLTGAEKRYFKIFASKHTIGEKNNYEKLFESIEKQEVYDEENIKMVFKDEIFIRHLPSEKNYLYHLILDSLHSYHLNLTSESKLNKWLSQVSVLYNKCLYDQCRKLLVKIKEVAMEMGKYDYAFQVLTWQKKLMLTHSYTGITEDELLSIIQESHHIVENLKNANEYNNLESRLLFLINKSGEVRDKKQKEKYYSVIKNPLLQSEKKAFNHTAKCTFNNIHLLYNFYAKGDMKNTYKYAKRYLTLLESTPKQIAEDAHGYVTGLNNFLVISIHLKQYKEAQAALKKMRDIDQTFKIKLSPDIQLKIFIRSYLLELDMYINSGAFDKITSVIPDIEKGMEVFSGKINKANERILHYNISYLYFGLKEYKKALEWLNKILNATDTDTKQDIICFAKILQMIIHLELNHRDFLPYLIKSNYRFFSKRKRIYKGETIILNYIKNYSKATTQNKLMDLYKDTLKNFVLIANDPFEKKIFRYFDFISWMESKIENSSFAEIVQRKAQEEKTIT